MLGANSMVIGGKYERCCRSIYMLIVQLIEKRVLMNRILKINFFKSCFFPYRGILERIPAVIEPNVSLKRGLIFPRYQAIASSTICKTTNN